MNRAEEGAAGGVAGVRYPHTNRGQWVVGGHRHRFACVQPRTLTFETETEQALKVMFLHFGDF